MWYESNKLSPSKTQVYQPLQEIQLYPTAFSMNLWLQLLHFVDAAAFYDAALAEVFGYKAYNDTEGLTGYLAGVILPNACHAILQHQKKASERYIALIQGYDCSFAGYHMALVYNVDSEQLITMMYSPLQRTAWPLTTPAEKLCWKY
uniref:Uncharacterized protein n=1 Tax=Bubo bubo TaxID=30461 RepID=A0A8C0F4T7_BUBBB